jgi:hypothetical protein
MTTTAAVSTPVNPHTSRRRRAIVNGRSVVVTVEAPPPKSVIEAAPQVARRSRKARV